MAKQNGKRTVLLLDGTHTRTYVYRRAHHGADDGFIFRKETVTLTDPHTGETTRRTMERMKDVRRAPDGTDVDFVQLELDGSMPELPGAVQENAA